MGNRDDIKVANLIRPPFDEADCAEIESLCEKLIEVIEREKKGMSSCTAKQSADDIIDTLIDVKVDTRDFLKKLEAKR